MQIHKRFAVTLFLIFVTVANASLELQNSRLLVWVTANGSLQFTDKQNNVTWGYDIPGWVELESGKIKEKIPLESGMVDVQKQDDMLRVRFNGINGKKIREKSFELIVDIRLKDNYLDVCIDKVATSKQFKSLEYPAHTLHVNSGVSDGYIVVPHLQGIVIPSRYDAGFMRYGQNIWSMITDKEEVWSFESGSLNMPWYGATLQGSSVLAHVSTSYDCQLRVIGNAVVGESGRTVNARRGGNPGTRLSSLSPIWLASKNELSYSRKVRFELVSNGYVGMAKRYLDYAKGTGRYVTMREKIAANPEYAKLIGAPDVKIYIYTNRKNGPYWRAWSEPVLNGYSKVHTTFEQVGEMATDLKAMGVDKCMVLLGGWNRMGYDREHVDMWPPAEKAGGVTGLQAACKAVKDQGYLFALHDNYNDFYADAPSYDDKYIIRESDGSLRKGGVWDGGPCFVTCSAMQGPLLNRNLDYILGPVPLNGYYFDVVTSVSPYECFSPDHPNTRESDLQHRKDLFFNIYNRGLVVGGERGADWSMPAAAFYEGMQGGGTGYHRGVAYRIGLTVPLFYLVYHDCVVGYWQHGTPYGREDHANHVLLDLLCAQPSSWSIVYDQWKDLKSMIKDTYDLLGPLHVATAHQAMSEHKVLTDDWMVQTSTFDNGIQVWVNYGITTWQGKEIVLPPKGFAVKMADGTLKKGIAGRKIEWIEK